MAGVPFTPIDSSSTEALVTPGLLSSNDQVTSRLHRVMHTLTDLVFPPRCAGCGRVDTRWCGRCQQAIDQIPLLADVEIVPPLTGIASTGLHAGKLQDAVHALKYTDTPLLAAPLAARMAARLTGLAWTIDMVVPVPLHRTRRQSRGYNQSELLAQRLANQLKLPMVSNALTRNRDTRPQVGLTREQRRANVHKAFYGEAALLAGRTILIIDDVYTTGATLSACAQAALDAGAVAVFALTVTSAQ